MARLRKVAMARGAVPAWTVEASSAKVTSRMWCEEFSIPQCPRIAAARSAGPALVGVEAGDGVDALAGLAAGRSACGGGGRGWRGGRGERRCRRGSSAMAQVLIERDSRRPWPVAEAVCWTAMIPPGQGGELGVGGGLVGLDDGDVVGLLRLDQPGDVGLDRVQGIEGDHGAGQVQRRQQRAGSACVSFVFAPTSTWARVATGAVGDRGEQMPARRGRGGLSP